MDRERLKELREETEQYRAVADDRCMSTQYEDDMLALINAALAEPSDAEVAEAIEFWEKIKRQSIRCIKQSQNGKSYQVNLLPTLDNAYALDLAITALRQYQKPTDEAVHPDDLDSATEDAVEWLEHMKSCHIDSWNNADDEDTSEPGAYEQYKATIKAIDTAITALRQMRSAPCEWCDKDGPETWNYTRSGKYIPEYQAPRRFCGNCGRYIGGDSHD